MALMALVACSPSVAPAVMMDLRSLPVEPERRNAVLESTAVRPGPETRKPLPGKLQQVETAAASAAAVLGMLFSTSPNVLLGAGMPIDENQIVAPGSGEVAGGEPPAEGEQAAGKTDPIDTSQLVPWVRLHPVDPD